MAKESPLDASAKPYFPLIISTSSRSNAIKPSVPTPPLCDKVSAAAINHNAQGRSTYPQLDFIFYFHCLAKVAMLKDVFARFVLADENISRFDVAMDNATVVEMLNEFKLSDV